MAATKHFIPFLFLIVLLMCSFSHPSTFTITNKCRYPVWPGLVTRPGTSNIQLITTGFALPPGESNSVTVPASWIGRIWGRTHCTLDDTTGNFTCLTGDCGSSSSVQCTGGGAPPATLLEFTLNGSVFLGHVCVYDVSLVDGYNVPVVISPQGGTGGNCTTIGCSAELNNECPSELKVTDRENGSRVGCKNACSAFNEAEYCCTGDYSSPETCKATNYSNFFKSRCPQAYSYPFDDATSTFTCAAVDYGITFCPSSLLSNRGEIKVGDNLTAGYDPKTWVSLNGDFAFGFHQLENKDLYLLAIWYNKIPETTIVWYANGDAPAPRGSKLNLTADRGLVLTGPQGTEIWKSEIGLGEAAYASMNDTGSFMITDSTGVVLWQSFDDPRDTLLPGQTLEKGGRKLNSRLRENNFSLGRFQFQLNNFSLEKFQFKLIPEGNVVLNYNNVPTGVAYGVYFDIGTADTDTFNVGLQIVFNETGYLYVLKASNETQLIIPSGRVSDPFADYYHRVTLHFDGVLAQYSYPRNSNGDGNWSVIFKQPDNICNSVSEKGSGPCGFNGICQLTDDQRAACLCPPNFSLLDPTDAFGGCRPDFYTQFCEEDVPKYPQDFEYKELVRTDWPTSDYEMYKNFTLEECQDACTQDCFCKVIVHREETCWKKKLPLSNGRKNESVDGKAFIKVSTRRSLPPKKNKDSLVVLVSSFLGGSVFVNLLLAGFVGLGLFFFNRKSTASPQALNSNLRYFTHKELMEATNGFKEELGRGSFGIVYKGLIKMGNNVAVAVAVKKVDRIVADTEKEFRTEVEVIGQTHHKNLVQLVGFCDEGQHRLLVYEFLSNGTLSSFLFGDIKPRWEQRIQIAFGIAKGLVYLHEECGTQIIHCDIKPQNILLDENYDAKIADFGLAKLLFSDQSRTLTAIRGTKGYVAPEWFRNLPVSSKVDVYSFGVLLLEIICRRRSVDKETKEAEAILTDWAYDCYVEGKIESLVENDEEAMNDMKKVERFVMVALWCVQEDPNLRPTMMMVRLMLAEIVKVTAPPCPCPFSVVS